MKIFQNILELTENYNAFILDVWGVLHSSGVPFENVFNSLEGLKKQKKRVILLSNAPRRAEIVAKFLNETVGIKKNEHYEEIITSGEVFYLDMKSKFKNTQKVFYLGPDKDLPTFEGLNFNLTNNLNEDFNFAVVTGMLKHYQTILQTFLNKNITLYCTNPDIFIKKQDGSKEECAGFVALEYKKMGGKVIYYGKPHNEIYKHTLNYLKEPKETLLAVGDGPETDILGANNAGISSCLCLSGLPSLSLKAISFEEYFKNLEVKPDFIIKAL